MGEEWEQIRFPCPSPQQTDNRLCINRSSQFRPRPDFNSARPDFIQNGRPNFENDDQSSPSRPDFNPEKPDFDTRKLFLKPKIGQSAAQSGPVDLLFVPLNDNVG